MANITKYNHHGVDVFTIAEHIGIYKSICLCTNGCKRFKPNYPENCEIAQANFENCVKFNTVQPITECPKFIE